MPDRDNADSDDAGKAAHATPEHLNSFGCRIAFSEQKGRCVQASKFIPIGTVIEISPVLLFTKEEYEEHGRHTILDQYTFKWRDGRMALALGLGSLFNHSETPNVSFILDTSTNSIRFTTARDINPDEEMCIFYGFNLWFQPAHSSRQTCIVTPEPTDDWGGLAPLVHGFDNVLTLYPDFLDGNADDIIPPEELPFTRLKVGRDEEEEHLDEICTVQVWVVDIPDLRHITTMLKWMKKTNLDAPELGHLKRIRKKEGITSFLLSTSPICPSLPEDLNLSDPYKLDVPRTAALTITSLQLKCSLWPTIYAPRRKGEVEAWTRGKARWAWHAMRTVVEAATHAHHANELPIIAHVPASFEDSSQLSVSFTAHDTRLSTAHPLRHAVLNVVRQIADYRASSSSLNDTEAETAVPVERSSTTNESSSVDSPHNGNHYLLTSLSLFITHEPCIMCSMALLHSRVKEIFYFKPMGKTGGCGGLACIPKLEGVNHRFGINQWKTEGEDSLSASNLEVDEEIDA